MCPWIDWQPATMKFCEELLCGYVRQPANSFSNLGFVIMGLIILKKEGKGWSHFHLMGVAAILIGITSGIYHASMTFFWQFFDVSSMNMLIALPICYNLMRLSWIRSSQMVPVYLGILASTMLAMYLIQGKIGEWMFGGLVVVVVTLEFLNSRREKGTSYKAIFQAMGIFLLAFLIWNGDVRGWWCDPTNHFVQGHAIWHLMCAGAIWYLYQYYRQFALLKRAAN